MGRYRYEPFENICAVAEYGGYRNAQELSRLFWEGISKDRGKTNNLIDAYEILGIILRTFRVYYGIMSEDYEKKILNAIKTKEFTKDLEEYVSDVSMIVIYASAININIRKRMIIYATKIFREWIVNNIPDIQFNERNLWASDSSIIDTGNSDKKRELFERNQCYREVYNIAQEIINTNFRNIKEPMVVREEDIGWINRSEMELIKEKRLWDIKQRYPNGFCILDIGFEEIIGVDNTTKLIVCTKSDIINIGRIIREAGKSFGEFNIRSANSAEWFRFNYPIGFYLINNHNYKELISIDTERSLIANECKDKCIQYMSRESIIRLIALMVPVIVAPNNECIQNIDIIRCIHIEYSGEETNSRIKSYTIQMFNGNELVLQPEQFREILNSGKYICTNIKITANGRLIACDN